MGDAPVPSYRPLIVEIVKFFRTKQPPVAEKETLEIYAFMEAADESKRRGGEPVELKKVHASAVRLGEKLAPYLGDASERLAHEVERGKAVLFEGAQGTLLDVDHGTYPFVTSSNTVAGNAAVGAGLGPTSIHSVIGISKAYTTREKRLLAAPGRPNFDISFYALSKAGQYGSAVMYAFSSTGKRRQFAVADASGARKEDCAFLFERH